MKTFYDLTFQHHHSLIGMKRAVLNFENGYGVSVLNGPLARTSGDEEYELAVLKDNEICYDTYITDDVLGYLSKEEVTEIMKQVQEL